MNTLKLSLATLFLYFICGCGRTPAPIVSPDGSLVAAPDDTGVLVVTIKKSDGTVLYVWKTGASNYSWWDVYWKDNDRLEMESGDIGAYILERLPDNTWRETTPGGVFSPDGKTKVQISWDSKESKKLRVWFGGVSGTPRSYSVQGDFQTDLEILDTSSCARWDGNDRLIVKTVNGEHSWIRKKNGGWAREI